MIKQAPVAHPSAPTPGASLPPPAGTHCALLIFSSLGWRLPLPAHLGVQTAAVAMLAGWGMHPHLQSQVRQSGAGAWCSGRVPCPETLRSPWPACRPLRVQLLSSPQTRSMVASLHSAASFLSGMLVPSAVLKPPDGEPCAGAAPP